MVYDSLAFCFSGFLSVVGLPYLAFTDVLVYSCHSRLLRWQ